MKKLLLITLLISLTSSLFGAERITGLWKSIDDKTEKTKSISIIYEYRGKIYGRMSICWNAICLIFNIE